MMNQKKQKIINFIMFATGAAIGSLVTYKLVKEKYERILQEEIDSVKETWADMARGDNTEYESCEDGWDDYEEDDADDDEDDDSVIFDYHSITSQYKVAENNINDEEEGGDGEGLSYINGPYVIDPDDFASGRYNRCDLSYYKDGILADTWDVEMDIEETIGEDALEHFGDHVDDVVHVRNDRLEIDYEVVRDPRTYAEVLEANSPKRMYAD